MKKLAVFAVAAVLAATAFGAAQNFPSGDDPQYGWWDGSITIGSYTGEFIDWSSSPDSPSFLGTFSDLTVTSISFNIWANSDDRGGANMYFRIYDDNGQVGNDQDIHVGSATKPDPNEHNYSVSWTGSEDLAAATGLQMEEGKDYYVDMWAKTYGTSGDQWYSNESANYHAKFTYSTQTPAVPEPATMSLLGLGALAMVLRRKLRK